MSYTIYNSNGTQLLTLLDGTLDTSTGLNLVGKNYVNYGVVQNENFVWLLENFASDTQPAAPMTGQLWYNTKNKVLTYYDGTIFNGIPNASVLSDGLSSLYAALAANVAMLQAEITSNVAALYANATVQDTSIKALWANAAVQDTHLTTIDGEVATLNSEVVALQNTTSTLTTGLASTNSTLTSTRSNVTSLTNTVTALTSEVHTDENRITTLENAGFITTVALVTYAPLNSPALTGTPTTPTATLGDQSETIASTYYVMNQSAADRATTTAAIATAITNLSTTIENQIATLAPINNPVLTGVAQAPTLAYGDVSANIATTAHVRNATQYWDGSRKYVSASGPDNTIGVDGDFWFQYQ